MPRPARSRAFIIVSIIVLTSLGNPSLAFAAGERDRAIQLAREGRCESALPALATVRDESPQDAEASLVAGQCLIRLQRYDEAAAAVEVARAVSPELENVDVSLAIARYHLEQYDAADAALDRAEARNANRANVQLYRGLLLLVDADNQAGVDALERARSLNREYAEPVSSFYQGLALAEIEERDRARRALLRVVDEWPGSDWAVEANQALDTLAEPAAERWWLNGSIGAEYDSNVILRGTGVDLPDDISDDDDWRGLWTIVGGARVIQHPEWVLGLSGSYYGTEQDDVDEFDTDYLTGSLWLDHPWSKDTHSRLQYEFGHAWVDQDPYLLAHRAMTSLFQNWDTYGQTELFGRYAWNDFQFKNRNVTDATGPATCFGGAAVCGPAGLNELDARNRDGHSVTAGVEQTLPLPELGPIFSPSVRGGYAYTWYGSRGSEYDYQQHAFSLGGAMVLPLSVGLDADFTYAFRPYDNRSTFPDPLPTGFSGPYTLDDADREDNQWTVRAALSRAITENLGLSLYWRFDDNNSNVDVFDYDRHVVGLKLTGSLSQ